LNHENGKPFYHKPLDNSHFITNYATSSQQGFEVLPWRWIVERTFGWLGRYRRMSKEYDALPATTEAFIRIAMIKLMLGRLTTPPPSQRKRAFSTASQYAASAPESQLLSPPAPSFAKEGLSDISCISLTTRIHSLEKHTGYLPALRGNA
jgi:hypothetical protein